MNLAISQGDGGSGCEFYIFYFREQSTVPCKLVVTKAADALLVCRLGCNTADYEITYDLVTTCRFTLSSHPYYYPLTPPIACADPNHTLPNHLPGYQFTRKDYDDYIDQDSFTTACLFVGIYYIWCLVVATISLDKVLHGPLALAAGNQML